MNIDIWLICFFVFAIFASYLVKFEGKHPIAKYFGLAVGAFAISFISIDVCLINPRGLSTNIWYVAVDIQIALAYLISILIHEQYLHKLTLQRKLFIWIVVPFIVINLFIISNKEFLGLNESQENLLISLKIIFQSILQIGAFVNALLLFLRFDRKSKKSKYFLMLAIAFLFTAVRGVWDTSYYLSTCTIKSEIFDILSQVFYLFAAIIFIYVSVKLNAFGGNGKKFTKKFLFYLLENFAIIALFTIILYIKFEGRYYENYELFVLIPLIGFLVTQHLEEVVRGIGKKVGVRKWETRDKKATGR